MIQIFQTKIRRNYENKEVLLNTNALSILFDIDRSEIVKYINNIYKEEELDENSTCAKIAHWIKREKLI